MKVHTEHLTAGDFVAKEGAQVDLSRAGTFIVPHMETTDLPDPASVNGMLVWDTTVSALKLACGVNWEIISIVS